MAVWEPFLRELGKDYRYNGTESCLCRWLRAEKEQDFRLVLRKRRRELWDTFEKRRDYGIFLIRSILEEPRLRPLQGSLKSLSFLPGCGAQAPFLQNLLRRLEGGEEELSMEILLALSEELLDGYSRSKERADAYVELRAVYLDWKEGRASGKDYLRHALNLLQKRERMPLREESRKCLTEYAVRAGGQGVFDGARRNAEKYRRLAELLDKPQFPEAGGKGLEDLHEDLLETLLMKEARNFLYDSGVPAGEKSDGEGASSERTARRRKDRMMDLMDFCQENCPEISQIFSREENREAEREEIKALFERMQKSERYARALVPVRRDRVSGAGIYIVGRKWLPERYHNRDVFREQVGGKVVRKSCCYAYIHFDRLAQRKKEERPLPGMEDGNDRLYFRWAVYEYEFGYPTLEEALDWYEDELSSAEPLEFYRKYNGQLPGDREWPVGLSRYFAVSGRPADSELEADSEDVGREKQKYEKELIDRKRRKKF